MLRSLIGLVALPAVVPASAAELVEWGVAGEWRILIDAEVGNGCLMQQVNDDGTLLQVGVVPNRNGGFFAAYNAGWTGIMNGVEAEIRFDFDDTLFGGDAVGDIENGMPGGYVFFDNPAFIEEFARRSEVRVHPKGASGIAIDLTGTAAASGAVRACQAEQDDG